MVDVKEPASASTRSARQTRSTPCAWRTPAIIAEIDYTVSRNSELFSPGGPALWRAIGEDRFPAAVCQQKVRGTLQLLRVILIGPQENAGCTSPEGRKRLRRFEHMRSIRKLFSVPEVSTGRVQHAQRYVRIEVERRGLMIFAVDDDQIARPVFLLNRRGEIIRRENRREARERNMYTGQQPNHHHRQSRIPRSDPLASPHPPVHDGSQQ